MISSILRMLFDSWRKEINLPLRKVISGKIGIKMGILKTLLMTYWKISAKLELFFFKKPRKLLKQFFIGFLILRYDFHKNPRLDHRPKKGMIQPLLSERIDLLKISILLLFLLIMPHLPILLALWVVLDKDRMKKVLQMIFSLSVKILLLMPSLRRTILLRQFLSRGMWLL